MHAKLLGALGTALAVLALAGTPAEAQWRGGQGSGAYESGYRDGARAGNDDARDGRGYEYQRHRDYRSADPGYDRRDRRSRGLPQQYPLGLRRRLSRRLLLARRPTLRVGVPQPAAWLGGGVATGEQATAAGFRTTSAIPTASRKATSAESTTAATATATTRAATAAIATPIRATAASTDRRASTKPATAAASSAAMARATRRPATRPAMIA